MESRIKESIITKTRCRLELQNYSKKRQTQGLQPSKIFQAERKNKFVTSGYSGKAAGADEP